MLQIRTQNLKLGYNITQPNMQIRTTPSKFEGDTSLPKLEMKSTQVKLKIDQTECFNESGLKNIEAFLNDNVSHAKEMCSEAVLDTVRQGDELADIQNKNDPIPEQAFYNTVTRNLKELTMVTMPKSRPKITVINGNVDINLKKGDNNKNFIKGHADINYTKGKTSYKVERYNSVDIKYIGNKNKIDISV